jgi:hypothetical protein
MRQSSVTTKTERLVLALRRMSEEIEPKLHLVSHEALDEWRSVQGKWPSDGQLRDGAIGLTEGQLEAIEAKVRRFRDIVRALASTLSEAVPLPSIDGEGSTSAELCVSDT